jgi:hypothetical protein
MPFIELTITTDTAEAEYRVFYATSQEVPAGNDGPGYGGLDIAGVHCVAIRQHGSMPLVGQVLDAIQADMVAGFWRRYSHAEVLELCAADAAGKAVVV